LKEKTKEKDKKEVELQKEIGQQTQALVQVKEELLAKNERALQMESQIEELEGIQQKNKRLEDSVRSLKKEVEALKRDRVEWESEQLELMFQREKHSKQHPHLQQDLNQSGLSNISGYTQNKKSKPYDQSEAKFQQVSRIQTSLENTSAAKQFVVLEKQRFNSLEKIAGLSGSVSSTTGGGPHTSGGNKLQNFIQKQAYQSQQPKNQQSKSQNTAMQLTKIYTSNSMNMTGNANHNQMGKAGGLAQN